jgi:hypothetical protein
MSNAHTLSGEARSNMHHYCGRTVTTDALFTVGYVPDLTPFVGGDSVPIAAIARTAHWCGPPRFRWAEAIYNL